MGTITTAVGIAVLAAGVGFGVYATKHRTKAEADAAVARADLVSLQTQLDAVRRTGAKSEQRAVRAEEQLTELEQKTRGLFPSVRIAAEPAVGGGPFLVAAGGGSAPAAVAFSRTGRADAMRQILQASSRFTINSRNLPFYRQSGFTAEQRERFNEVLFEVSQRQEEQLKTALDQARPKGQKNVQAVLAVASEQAEGERTAAVKQAFGDAVAETYQRFLDLLPVRGVTDQLASALFYSDAPLTAQQAEALVDIMSQTGRIPGGKTDALAIEKSATLAAAQAVLSAAQLKALGDQIDQAKRPPVAAMR